MSAPGLYNDLVAFYPLSEGSGLSAATIVNSSIPGSSQSLNATIPGSGVSWSNSGNGWTGKGLSFSGVSGQGVVLENFFNGAYGTAFVPRNGYSLALWLKSNTVPGSGLLAPLFVSDWNTFPLCLIGLFVNHSGQVVVRWWSYASTTGSWTNSVTGTKNVLDGNAHHIAVTCTTTGYPIIYVDGAVDAASATANDAGTNPYLPYPYALNQKAMLAPGTGGSPWTAKFTGTLGPCGFWSRVLTAYEVKTLSLSASASAPFAPVTYALAGFHPGKTNPSWFTTAPTVAQLNALYAASNLSTLCGAITWAYVYTLQSGQSITQAINAAIALNANFGADSSHRGAILIPNGTYVDDAHPLKMDNSVLPAWIDLIGQSKTGVIIKNTSPLFDTNGNGGYPVIHSSYSQIIAHCTLIRADSLLKANWGTINFTVSGGVLSGLTIASAGGPGYVDGVYDTGYGFQVSVTTSSGALATVAYYGGTLPANNTYTGVALTAQSRYCVHMVQAPGSTVVHYDIDFYSQTYQQWYNVGMSGNANNSYTVCCTGNYGFFYHDAVGETGPTHVEHNNVQMAPDASLAVMGSLQFGFQWQDNGTGQPNTIVLRGSEYRGANEALQALDVTCLKEAGTPATTITLDQVNVATGSLATNIDSSILRNDNPGGVILCVDPPIRESAILATQGLTAAAIVSGNTIDDTAGTSVVPAAADVRHGTNVGVTTGSAYIPAAADVRHGTNVDATTGTCYVPAAAQTLYGVNVDATTGTVTLPNTDGHTPDASQVLAAAHFGAGNATQGTLDLSTYTLKSGVAAAADVRHGTARYSGGPNGTCYVPSASDVRYGTNVDATTGSCYVPTAAQTLYGVNVDATTGTVTLPNTDGHTPDASQVSTAAHFGAGNATQGALDLGTYTLKSTVAAAADVRHGTACYSGGPNGTCYVPTAADVRHGTNVDATTGTCYVPAAANVLSGVPVDNTVGTYTGGTTTMNTVQGSVTSAATPSATSFATTLTPPSTGSYVGAPLTFTSGALAGQSATILSFTATNGVVTFAAGKFSAAPSSGDNFAVGDYGLPQASQVQYGVQFGYNQVGTFTSNGVVVYSSPVSAEGATFSIIQGNDYSISEAAPLVWTDPGWWPALSGATSVYLTCRDGRDTLDLQMSCAVIAASGGNPQRVIARPTHIQTDAMSLGGHTFDLQAVFADGGPITLVQGSGSVTQPVRRT